jgi:hypothetical protein
MTREEMVALGRDEVGYEEGARNQVSALSARVEELERLMAETLEAGIPIMGDSSMNDVWCYFCSAEAGMAAQIEHSSGCLWTRLLRALAPKEASK